MADRAYLDYNATAPLRPQARAALLAAFDRVGNPSSVHADGREARRVIELARRQVAQAVGVVPEDVVFTSGATEANSMVLRSGLASRLLVSAIEHDSVLANAPQADRIPVDDQGRVDLGALAALLAAGGGDTLVSVMAVNNETGVIQPLEELGRLCARHGALLHVDAAQALGRIPLQQASIGAHLLTLSAHKLGGPMGVGALVASAALPVPPLLRGGGQERGRRPGTEAVPPIAGFGAAVEAVLAQGPEEMLRVGQLRDRLEAALRAEVPGLAVHGAGAARVANTACLSMPGVPSETQIMALDLAGVSVSAGSACSSGKVRTSHVLGAMGVDAAVALGAVRFSLGWASAAADIDRAVTAWLALYRRKARAA